MDVAFKIYTDGLYLIAVVFPKDGGKPLLKQKWNLNSIGLKSMDNLPHILDIPSGNYKIKSEKVLERGGLRINVDYNTNRFNVIPVLKKELKEYSVVYRFEDIGVMSHQTTEIQKAITVRNLRARKDKNQFQMKNILVNDI